ncbi:large ribosomal subunit protein bL17m-like [Watersipora subatra]|uniref:large ribosomal subunit protein bL17m-like n=1 Tax=Watersipora subatra TaxID=2589382 RepID=UPI00355C925F
MNRLRIPVADRARKLSGVLGMGSGPEGRMLKLRSTVTKLIRHERLEGSYRVLDESRGYVELLIQQACKHGPEHEETMAIANHWLQEKDLVQKLFKVLVPRYTDYTESYTSQYMLPVQYPENRRRIVLELKGNAYPAVIEDPVNTSKWLNNVLLDAARKNLSINSPASDQVSLDADFELAAAPSEGSAV